MAKNRRWPFNFLMCMLSIFVGSSLLFLDSFFQASKHPIGRTEERHYDIIQAKGLDEYSLQPPLTKYDQIILMVIDAWRADYPNATNMPFAYKHACNHLQIMADIPTVTMPRLKSITTGTISNFIDIVLNLGHVTKLDDSILHRLAEKDKKSVFAGDRTWVQLFPNTFLREFVNTDSFFVKDFYEGDLNVTKILRKELQYSDWNLMILHYLGLDHIGHVEGSHSDKIYGKLFEMDDIIKYITENMHLRSLLLLTGDHGMRNGGSHGGSDREEVYVPLMAFEKNCHKAKRSYAEYNQIDISASLAVLLDVKIPQTSIGCLISDLLENYSKEEQLYLFHYNALHLMEKIRTRLNSADIEKEEYFTWYKDAKASHKEFISSQATSFLSYEIAKQNYIRLSKKISQYLSESLVQYNMPQIFLALSLTVLCAIKLIMNVIFETDANSMESNQIVSRKFFVCLALAGSVHFFVHLFGALNTPTFVRSIIFTFHIALIFYFAFDISKMIFDLNMPPLIRNRKVILRINVPSHLFCLFLCHTLSLASTSFIEEEHQTWYYFTPTLLILLTMQNFYNGVKNVWQSYKFTDALLRELWNSRSSFIVMVSLVGCRRLNQTGDKWRHMLDIGDVLSRRENDFYLTLTLLAGLILLLLLLQKHNSTLQMVFCCIALSCVFLYRQMQQHLFLILVLFWASLICTQLRHFKNIFYKRKKFEYETKANLVQLLETKLTCCFLISALLHKPHNVILLSALVYTLQKSYLLCDNLHIKNIPVYSRYYVLVLKTILTIFIANMFYFFQGNSNSLATIDLNPGYIGLSSYNPFVVGLLIALNTYCAHINAFLYLMCHILSSQRNILPLRQISDRKLMESTDLYLVYSLYTASTIVPVAIYWCILVGFRYHLFIYSVFAPKAFYVCFHLLVFYVNFIVTNFYFRLF